MPEPDVFAAEDDAAVDFLLAYPDLLDTLLTEHVKNNSGECAACPGPESGRRRWPCNVRLIAARAARVRQARRDAGEPIKVRPKRDAGGH